MKKTIATVLSIIFALSLIVVLFLTSLDIVIYGDMPGWFVSECVKYDTLSQVGIEEDDLAQVTTDMFEYLRNNRDSLADITATINGVPDTPYFNEKECMHMADCQKLFIAGYAIRRYCIIACVVILLVLILMFRKNISEVLHSLAVGTLAATISFTAIAAILAALIAANFNKYFTLFHLIFFDNDLWLLDPTKERLLMIMPTGYFIDCVKYIGGIFAAFLIILLVLSIVRLRIEKHKQHE